MNRREFIEKTCLGGIGLIVGASVLSSLDIPSIKASPRTGLFHGNREIPLRLEDTPELKEVGGAYHLIIEEIDKDLLVVRTGENSFVAVDIKCTHKGCEVKYEDKVNMFVCPCHDSHFDLTGNPKSGPAKKPLGTYRTILKDDEVTIHIPMDGDVPDPDDSTHVQKTDSSGTDSTIKK
ncbi:MAG: Rieske (2Fe-2S) protein [Bacteroidota bacterium]|nr:Rieske (2Fe-2S) protein [Bacteroidota bacterium]MDP4230458.1 Rieske (2Fe-2S) protein [Bacteroidota bacterium]